MPTAIKERPILFSGEMVRAILDGRKTQTRRVCKPQPEFSHLGICGDVWKWGGSEGELSLLTLHMEYHSPYGVPGDRLWVRETFRPTELESGLDGIQYQADDSFHEIENTIEAADKWLECYGGSDRWRPSIHMPRWACRLVLEVTEVRVERLQDISCEDAYAEGVPDDQMPIDVSEMPYPPSPIQGAFAALWNQINNKEHPWSSNPWVWVVSFERISTDAA